MRDPPAIHSPHPPPTSTWAVTFRSPGLCTLAACMLLAGCRSDSATAPEVDISGSWSLQSWDGMTFPRSLGVIELRRGDPQEWWHDGALLVLDPGGRFTWTNQYRWEPVRSFGTTRPWDRVEEGRWSLDGRSVTLTWDTGDTLSGGLTGGALTFTRRACSDCADPLSELVQAVGGSQATFVFTR